jgi:hypothetical protein
MAHDVFISYSSKDKNVADAACAVLEARGIRCWLAPRDILPGTEWGAAIINAIGAARVMVLIYTSSSNASPQVRREVERAVARGLHVIPFRMEDVPMSPALEYFISSPHWLDALNPPMERHLDHLGRIIKAVLDAQSAPAAEAAAAQESAGGSFTHVPPPGTVSSPRRVESARPPARSTAASNRALWMACGALAIALIAVVAILFANRAGGGKSEEVAGVPANAAADPRAGVPPEPTAPDPKPTDVDRPTPPAPRVADPPKPQSQSVSPRVAPRPSPASLPAGPVKKEVAAAPRPPEPAAMLEAAIRDTAQPVPPRLLDMLRAKPAVAEDIGPERRSALHLCAAYGNVAFATELVKINPNLVNAFSAAEETPLHVAAANNQAGVARVLLAAGASVRATTTIGDTPLHRAGRAGGADVVRILLDAGADPDTTNKAGERAADVTRDAKVRQVIAAAEPEADLVRRFWSGMNLDGRGFDVTGPGLKQPVRVRFRDGGTIRVEGEIGGVYKTLEGSYKKGPLTLTLESPDGAIFPGLPGTLYAGKVAPGAEESTFSVKVGSAEIQFARR